MTEIFSEVRDEVKDAAKTAWNLALAQKNPAKAAKFLNDIISYYSKIYTEEEINFLHFYFSMQMEMNKDE